MARVLAILAVFMTIAAFSLSLPNLPENNEIEEIVALPEQLDQKIGIPTSELLKALEAQTDEEGIVGRGQNLFNLSAYVNAPGRPPGGGLTFVPLITVLSAVLGFGGNKTMIG